MTGHHVAVMVYSELKAPLADPQVRGFVERAMPFFELAVQHEGYVRHTGKDRQFEYGEDPTKVDWGPWGPFDDPYWYDGPVGGPDRLAVKNLSVWEDLESLRRYTYRSQHLEAVQMRREWMVDRGVPSHVAFWIEAGTLPSIAEACRRIEHLHEHGPTAHAFTLAKAFTPDGAPEKRKAATS